MSRPVTPKAHSLPLRFSEADIAVIDRAAMRCGWSRTDFVRGAAVQAAEEILMGASPNQMTATGFEAFAAALSGPPATVPELVEVFRRPAPWDTGRAVE